MHRYLMSHGKVIVSENELKIGQMVDVIDEGEHKVVDVVFVVDENGNYFIPENTFDVFFEN